MNSAIERVVRPHLLVVDDQPINIQTLHQIFRDDHEVFMATSGQQALDFCRHSPPDLILLDVVMPGMDGIETCRQLKTEPATAHIPIIFVTAQDSPADETRALEAGGVDFITKPVVPAVVRARVKTHLTLRAQNEHLEQLVEARTTALSIAKEAAESANRTKSTFLATMSHELRTPLNAIMGYTALAARLATDPKVQEYLAGIDLSARKLLSLVNNILDASRLEGQRLTLLQEDFCLSAMLNSVIRLMAPEAAAKSIVFRADIPPELDGTMLRGDPQRLEQILLNLVGNGLKFTSIGSVVVRVSRLQSVSAKDNTMRLRFEVEDTGIGISSIDQERLFFPFEQVDGSKSRPYDGAGLGLAISKQLVRLMGGEIGIKSTPSEGSTLWFTVALERA